MFIKDLNTRAYFVCGRDVRSVGWLEARHPYQRGAVPDDFMARLKHHVATAYQPGVFLGFHECSLCPGGRGKAERENLLIPTKSLLYVAPSLIVHYIEDHGYRPPQEFIEAVMACPEQKSDEFIALLERFEPSWT